MIDYFLARNEPIQDIGKLIISVILLRCEAAWLKNQKTNLNRKYLLENSPWLSDRQQADEIILSAFKDDWVRFILHRLVTDCESPRDLIDKRVNFVTFNYDVSLEQMLFFGVESHALF